MKNEREIKFIGKFQKKYSFINLLVYPSTDLFTFLCLNYLKIIVFFLGLFYKIFLHQTFRDLYFWLYFFIFIPLNSATYIRDFLMAETKCKFCLLITHFNWISISFSNAKVRTVRIQSGEGWRRQSIFHRLSGPPMCVQPIRDGC